MAESVCYGKNKRGFQETVFLLTLKHLRIKRYLGWSQKKGSVVKNICYMDSSWVPKHLRKKSSSVWGTCYPSSVVHGETLFQRNKVGSEKAGHAHLLL